MILSEQMIGDIENHATQRLETILVTTFPLIDDPKQQEGTAIALAGVIFGFAIRSVQTANKCSYPEATKLLAESLVKSAMAVPKEVLEEMYPS